MNQEYDEDYHGDNTLEWFCHVARIMIREAPKKKCL